MRVYFPLLSSGPMQQRSTVGETTSAAFLDIVISVFIAPFFASLQLLAVRVRGLVRGGRRVGQSGLSPGDRPCLSAQLRQERLRFQAGNEDSLKSMKRSRLLSFAAEEGSLRPVLLLPRQWEGILFFGLASGGNAERIEGDLGQGRPLLLRRRRLPSARVRRRIPD